MYAYCGNNPVMFKDSSGNSTEAAISIWELLKSGIAAAGTAVAGTISSTGAFVGVVVLAIGFLGYSIYDSFTASPDGAVTGTPSVIPPTAVQSEENETSKSIPIPDSIADSTIGTKEKERQVFYWTAERIGKDIVPLLPLSYSEAREWVACERNLLCLNHSAAIAIVKFYPSAKHDKAHRACYLNHYHLNSEHSNHIWYYGD